MRGLLYLLLAAVAAAAGADPVASARELFEAGRYGEAYALLEPEVGGSATPGDRLLLTAICNRMEDWRCSVEHGKIASGALPSDSEAQYEYALALRHKISNVSKVKALFLVGDYKEALGRARELDPGNLDAREEEIGYLTNAPAVGGGDRDKALLLVEELQELDWRRGMTMRAELERAEGNDAEVERILTEVARRFPDDGRARLRLGFWHQRREQWRQADEQFAAVARGSDERLGLDALYQRGRSRVLGGYEAAQAVELFQNYLDRLNEDLPVPSRSNALWRQGMAYEQLGDGEAAGRAYREAVRLDPANKEAKRALRALD